MLDTISAENLRNYLVYQDRDTLINLIVNYVAKKSIPVTSNTIPNTSSNTDKLAKELQDVKSDLDQLQQEYDELDRQCEDLEKQLNDSELCSVEDAIALLWDDSQFNCSVEKAVIHARNLKIKDNSPIGELLRKLSYKVTIE